MDAQSIAGRLRLELRKHATSGIEELATQLHFPEEREELLKEDDFWKNIKSVQASGDNVAVTDAKGNLYFYRITVERL